MNLCLNCMEEYEEHLSICPHCEYKEDKLLHREYCLPSGMILNSENNSYLLGKCIDSDISGVVYIAWDNNYKRKVAIREYIPSQLSSRHRNDLTIHIYKENQEEFKKLMDKFVAEANLLRKIDDECCVKIFDIFFKHNTAYIVMEFVEGIVLKEFIFENGKINHKIAINMLMPIMIGIEKLHSMSEIYMSINAENIKVTKEGNLKIFDLSFVKYQLWNKAHRDCCAILLCNECMPFELFIDDIKEGTYTDIYSLASILYMMITGNVVECAYDRWVELKEYGKDALEPISRFNKNVPKNIANAIYNGINIEIKDRTQSIREFIDELASDKTVKLRVKQFSIIDRFKQKFR